MKTKHTTEICYNCGASLGLHHYETMQCPKNGMEACVNKKQEWDQRNIFQDSGLTKLHDAAPELLEALIELTDCDYTSGTHLSCAILKAKKAIKKAIE